MPDRSGYIGRSPGDSSIVLAKQYFQPTGAGKTFTFTSGYNPGYLDVYRNGVKLINVLDYAATDGSTVVLDTPVGVGSTVQVVAYKSFNLGDVNSSGADFSVGTNLYVQSGFGSFAQGITANEINVSGIGTIGIGSFVDVNISGAATVAGTLVAGSFSGDGSALTGVGQTLNVRTLSLTVAGVSTFTGALNATSVVSSGAVSGTTGTFSGAVAGTTGTFSGAVAGTTGTFSGAVAGTTGTFSGAVNVDATTDSTSSTSGALIVDGGLGVAKNVYIGAGLSVAGTLTYEDVTSVDSVGLITAKSGVNITGGQLTVGSGITMGIAGVATFSGTGDVHLHDNVRLNVGDASDLSIYHNGSHSYIEDSGTGRLIAKTSYFEVDNAAGNEAIIEGIEDGAVKLYYNGSKKFETTNDGVVITGICTADGLRLGDNESIKVGNGDDFEIKHDGSDSWIRDGGTGNLNIDSSTIQLRKYAAAETMAKFVEDAQVELYYDNSKKIETTVYGAKVTGIGSFTTQIKLNTNGTYLAENVVSFEPSGIAYIDHRTVGKNITFRMSSSSAIDTNAIIVGATGITTFSATPYDDKGNLRSVPRLSKSSAYVLIASDAGKCITITTGGVTINPSVMSSGDVVTIINDSGSNQTITQGSSMTLYDTGDDGSTGNKTLKGRGMATVWFTSDNNAYITGNFA